MKEYTLTEAATQLGIDISRLKKVINEQGINVERRPDPRDSQGHMRVAYISNADFQKLKDVLAENE